MPLVLCGLVFAKKQEGRNSVRMQAFACPDPAQSTGKLLAFKTISIKQKKLQNSGMCYLQLNVTRLQISYNFLLSFFCAYIKVQWY